jgi:holliday junction DNA helicase RuvA
MISFLKGTLAFKSPTEAGVDVGGVGYGVSIPLSTFEKLGAQGSEVMLLTHLHVREDVLQLFGFATEEERSLFRLLVSVNGIGPRMGIGILSGIPAADLRAHIASGNTAALTTIPGIGRKLAERLVLELREKIGKAEHAGAFGAGGDARGSVRAEAILALTSLGYSRPVAEKAVRIASDEAKDANTTLEALLKAALRHAAG